MALTTEQQKNTIHCLELLLDRLTREEMPDYYEITYCKKQLRKFKKCFEVEDETDHKTKNS
jgi:hypothetical protein